MSDQCNAAGGTSRKDETEDGSTGDSCGESPTEAYSLGGEVESRNCTSPNRRCDQKPRQSIVTCKRGSNRSKENKEKVRIKGKESNTLAKTRETRPSDDLKDNQKGWQNERVQKCSRKVIAEVDHDPTCHIK